MILKRRKPRPARPPDTNRVVTSAMNEPIAHRDEDVGIHGRGAVESELTANDAHYFS